MVAEIMFKLLQRGLDRRYVVIFLLVDKNKKEGDRMYGVGSFKGHGLASVFRFRRDDLAGFVGLPWPINKSPDSPFSRYCP